MSRLRANAPAIKTLFKAKPAMAKAIIKHADKELINTLCECCLNIAKGRVPLTTSQKHKLTKHKKIVRSLAKKSTSLKQRKLLLQRGGFLPALLGPLAPIIGSVVAPLVGGLFGK